LSYVMTPTDPPLGRFIHGCVRLCVVPEPVTICVQSESLNWVMVWTGALNATQAVSQLLMQWLPHAATVSPG